MKTSKPSPPSAPRITTKKLSPALWPAYEKLFGAKGACGGCWCMSWRVEKGENWNAMKGAVAKARMKALIEGGLAHGILAFDGDEPVGWCALGKRPEFAKLARSPSLACDDAEKVWSLPCFFVKAGYRGRGVAGILLEAATRDIRARGGRLAEGYPAKPSSDGKPLPGAFAWTGTRSLFEKAGFAVVGNPDGSKQRVRKAL